MGKLKDHIFRKRDSEDTMYAFGIAIGAITVGIMAGVSYKWGHHDASVSTARGIELFDKEGYIKFFNPATGENISLPEAVSLINARNNK